MTGLAGADRWVGVREAVSIYARAIGLSEDFLGGVAPESPGVMWFSDISLMVHDTGTGLAVDRGEFEVVMQQIVARLGVWRPDDA